MRTLLTTATAVGLLLAGAGTATADPKGEPFDLVCDNGQAYSVTTSGRGMFTPAHDARSTTTLVPIWFGNDMATVQPPDGDAEIVPFPGEVAKGGGNVAAHSPRQQVSCTYSFSFVLEVEEMGYPAGSQVTITGDVVGYVAGR